MLSVNSPDNSKTSRSSKSRTQSLPPAQQNGLRYAIESAVAHVFGIEPAEFRSPTRGRARCALARQVAMYLAHVACRMTYTDVGRLFARDRTTVAHNCGVVEDRRDDPSFDRALELLEMVVSATLSAKSLHGHLSGL